MIEADVTIANRLGLHARAAARFVHLANTFQSKVMVTKEGSRVDGKSILGLLTLAAARGSRLKLIVEGADERSALEGLAGLVRSGFGEED